MKTVLWAIFLCAVSILTLQTLAGRSSCTPLIPVLVYHHLVIEDADPANPAIMTCKKFRTDMQYIKDRGYEPISFEQLIAYHENRGSLPAKPIIITFDDGYLSNYELAYPILKEFNFKAAIFVIGVSFGNKDLAFPHFGKDEAVEMIASGLVSIESHTYDLHHNDILGVSMLEGESAADYNQRLLNDFAKINAMIEQNTGYRPVALSYPNCVFNEYSEQAAREIGYRVTLNIHGKKADVTKGLYSLTKFSAEMNVDLADILD